MCFSLEQARVEEAEVLVVGTHAEEPMVASNPAIFNFISSVIAKLQARLLHPSSLTNAFVF